VTYRYLLHGLRIATEIPLPEPLAELDGAIDLDIRAVAPAAVGRLTEEPVALRYGFDAENVSYEGFRDGSGTWAIQAPGFARITVRDTRVTVQLDPATDTGLLPMIASGLGVGFFLGLSGNLCLHASAVEVDGRAVVLSAPSGWGKSTLAALAAAAGHPLIGDDLLRIGFGAGGPDVYRGSSEIRLRPGAAALVEHWPDLSRITADGRTAVAPPRTQSARVPLGVIVFPVLDRERSDLTIERLRPADAFAALLAAPRILGWLDPAIVARQFEQLTALAAGVPTLVARVPWQSPAKPEIGAELVERTLSSL
jgi:hypothetical protein